MAREFLWAASGTKPWKLYSARMQSGVICWSQVLRSFASSFAGPFMVGDDEPRIEAMAPSRLALPRASSMILPISRCSSLVCDARKPCTILEA